MLVADVVAAAGDSWQFNARVFKADKPACAHISLISFSPSLNAYFHNILLFAIAIYSLRLRF